MRLHRINDKDHHSLTATKIVWQSHRKDFCEFYDVLHTQGHNWLIEEIDEMINTRKK